MKSGFISIIGCPNVGKSTLMNQIMGEKFSITSNKPQTTRNRIQCIYNYENGQAVFIDTPGLMQPKHKLDEYMVTAAEGGLSGVDVIAFVVESRMPSEREKAVIRSFKKNPPVILVINKIDMVKDDQLLKIVPAYTELYPFAEIVPVSAYEGTNVNTLLEVFDHYLPEGVPFFPPDMVTDQPERQIAAEFIREKALHVLDQEVPHGIAVVIDTFEERTSGRTKKDLLDINATIVCERESHKPIIIGKQGQTVKKIGSEARYELERFFHIQVNLKIFVKVRSGWRDSDLMVRNLGYDVKKLKD